MISVQKSIANWLMLEVLPQVQSNLVTVDIETIPNCTESENAGLFSSPDDIKTELIGGQIKKTEFKLFFIKKHFNTEENRQDNEDFKEKLEEIITNMNRSFNLPQDGRDWISIDINGGIYPVKKDDNNIFADYIIPLKLIYVL